MGSPDRQRVIPAALALGVVLAILVAFSGLLVPASQRAALGASITVTVLSGEPTARVGGGGFESVPDGAVLHAGDVIRTGPEARVVLMYFEGSSVTVEPGTELVIEEASFGEEGATIIRMSQSVGRTWHVVTKLLRRGSLYEVRSPVSSATVRGTAFEIAVDAVTGDTKVITTEGAVSTIDAAGTTEVIVMPGFETTVRANEPPAAPVPAAEPARKVSVQLESGTGSVVLDPLGRANGMRDGKLILQTPGASVVHNENGLLVILPNIPQGNLAVIDSAGARSEIAPAVAVPSRASSSGPADAPAVAATKTEGAKASEKTAEVPAASTPKERASVASSVVETVWTRESRAAGDPKSNASERPAPIAAATTTRSEPPVASKQTGSESKQAPAAEKRESKDVSAAGAAKTEPSTAKAESGVKSEHAAARPEPSDAKSESSGTRAEPIAARAESGVKSESAAARPEPSGAKSESSGTRAEPIAARAEPKESKVEIGGLAPNTGGTAAEITGDARDAKGESKDQKLETPSSKGPEKESAERGNHKGSRGKD